MCRYPKRSEPSSPLNLYEGGYIAGTMSRLEAFAPLMYQDSGRRELRMDEDGTEDTWRGWRVGPDRGRARFVAHYNAAFDFEAGLADIYRRARRADQVWPWHEAWGEMLPCEFVPRTPNQGTNALVAPSGGQPPRTAAAALAEKVPTILSSHNNGPRPRRAGGELCKT